MGVKDNPTGISENRDKNREKRIANLKPFKPGQTGNAGGRPKKKPITEIYDRLLNDPTFCKDLEKSIWAMVKSGRMVGQLQVKEMTDRVEGKITQPVEANLTMNLADAIAAARKRAGK